MWWYGALLLLHCNFILVLKAGTTDALGPFHLRLAGTSGNSVAFIWMNSAPKVMESRQINNVYLMVSRTNLQSAGHRVEWNIAISFMVNLFDPWPWDDRTVGTDVSGGFLDELIDIWVFAEWPISLMRCFSWDIYVEILLWTAVDGERSNAAPNRESDSRSRVEGSVLNVNERYLEARCDACILDDLHQKEICIYWYSIGSVYFMLFV